MNNHAGFNEGNTQSESELFRISKGEHLVRAFAVELSADDAVDMRENQINSILGEAVKGSTTGDDASQKGMIILNMWLLERCIWVAKEQRRFPEAIGCVFKGGNAAEFATVVRQKDRADIPEGEATALEFFLQRSQL